MSASSYPIPAQIFKHEIEVKKSRFIARVGHVVSREQALAFVEQAKADYPDARHHCWAYLLGNPASAATAAMNDAGEPSGTAGKPILNVIQHRGIGDVIVVVIRYFGGIKLGAGGLVRAYAGATQAALEKLPVKEYQPQTVLTLLLGFHQEQPLRHWASLHEAKVLSVNYTQDVTVTLALPDSEIAALQQFADAQGLQLQAHRTTQSSKTTANMPSTSTE